MQRCPSCGEENSERARFCQSCGTQLGAAAPPAETRRVVTILFCDLTGSTALGERLDPEALRRVMHRYYDAMAAVVERHGGTVEKFIGDAVMAVFGIPTIHEDDPLRAIRAAAEMQAEMATISGELERAHGVALAARIGVNTGEVIAGDPSAGQRLVTGDAVNVAARLEQAANAGEILFGATTHGLVRDAMSAEPVEPLSLKGKAEPVPAFRLLEVSSAAALGHARALDSPIVGREKELMLLRQALERATAERTSYLFTLLGAAGVGKSRLVQEFLATSTADATVLRGRCLSYGEGITYFAIGEIVHQAAGILDTDGPDAARGKLAALLAGAEDGERIASSISGMLGWTDVTAQPEDAAWAVRKLLEHLASSGSVVVEIDDIHWAEPLLLDLIDHLADWTRDAAVLLVCLARPELLDLRPGWAGGKLNATSILLEPLGGREAEQLIGNLLGEAALPTVARDRILAAAEGNPLFVEEMVGMLIDDGLLRATGDGWQAVDDLAELTVPPTIQLLLAARLDRLDAEERAVIERGAVEGKVFHAGAVTSLSPEAIRPRVRPRLLALARKELIRPDRAEFAGEDAFRFRHILIRDAAYHAMPKEQRADLHERFAAWLEDVAAGGPESYDEILAHHLEKAYRFRRELGIDDDRSHELGNRASQALRRSAEQVAERGDVQTAVRLAERAVEIAERHERDAAAVLLAELRYEEGRNAEALAAARSVLHADGHPDPRSRVRASVVEILARIGIDPTVQLTLGSEADAILRDAESTGDEEVLAQALLMRAMMEFWAGRSSESRAIGELLLPRARSMRFALRRSVAVVLMSDMVFGATHTSELDELVERTRLLVGDSVIGRLAERNLTGVVLGFRNQNEECDRAFAEVDAIWAELGHPHNRFALAQGRAEAFRALGRLEDADAFLRMIKEVLDDLNETSFNATVTAVLAVVRCELGDDEDAARFVDEARPMTASDDFAAHVQCAWTDAWLAAKAGRHDEATAAIDEAFRWLDGTDYLNMFADTHRYRGEALLLAGDEEGARTAFRDALAACERKGNIAMATRLRTRIPDA